MVMGRPNKGVDHVDSCEGSRQSKQRAKLILQTIAGERPVNDAMDRMGIRRAHFAKLRHQLLQAAVGALEPGRPGRPRKHDVDVEEAVADRDRRIADLERQLALERAKAELAPLLPGRKDGQKGGAPTRQEIRKRVRENRKQRLA